MKNEPLFVVIPAYNEEDNIQNFIQEWYPVIEKLDDARMIVINDGSKDHTQSVLEALAETRPKLEVLTKQNGGHGDTLLFGYRYAIEHGAKWIFQTDSDGQTRASEYMGFWEQREQYDAIFGCRKKRGDGAGRKFVEAMLCLILRLIFGVKVPDANCPFRLMRTEKVAEYIQKLPEHYELPNVMLTVLFVSHKDRVKFQEITFEDRKGGTNSINFKKIIKIGCRSIRDFSRFRREFHKK